MKQRQRKFVNALCLLWPAIPACAFLLLFLFQAGCALAGLPAVLGTPTSAETKVPAEYDLAREKDKKILVLVNQLHQINVNSNLRYFMTDSISKILEDRAKILPESLVSYDTLAEFRSNTPDFSLLPPEEVGARLGADFVLFVYISKCRIRDVGQPGYYSGALDAQAQLIKVSTGERLWPTMEQARTVQVGFETERRGADAAAVRLAVDAAQCITKYLYNCPKNQFKISDEISEVGWEK